MIGIQLAISFICLLYIISTICVGYKCSIEFTKWSLSKIIFGLVLIMLNLVCVVILISIWAI